MARLNTNPDTPIRRRIDAFADALHDEGHLRRAKAVRYIGREYEQRLGEGDVLGALAAFTSLDEYQDPPTRSP